MSREMMEFVSVVLFCCGVVLALLVTVLPSADHQWPWLYAEIAGPTWAVSGIIAGRLAWIWCPARPNAYMVALVVAGIGPIGLLFVWALRGMNRAQVGQ